MRMRLRTEKVPKRPKGLFGDDLFRASADEAAREGKAARADADALAGGGNTTKYVETET